jgi:hypothetical protein
MFTYGADWLMKGNGARAPVPEGPGRRWTAGRAAGNLTLLTLPHPGGTAVNARCLWLASALLLPPALAGLAADKDQYGDPLPPGAKARLDPTRMHKPAGGAEQFLIFFPWPRPKIVSRLGRMDRR